MDHSGLSKKVIKPEFKAAITLEAQGITCTKGFTELFSNISFSIPAGSILQATGTNGAGKTSLLRIIAGLARPEHGNVKFTADHNNDEDPNHIAYLGHKAWVKTGYVR